MYSLFTPDIEMVPVVVADRFGRAVNDAGITLVDWEGYIANPAMKYTIKAPSTRVILSSSEPRLYFNLPSWNGADGPRKELALGGVSSAEFYISIFPDRDGLDEMHSLTIEYRDFNGGWHTETIDVHVVDQDVPGRALDFDIAVDFSHDKTDLFDDPAARADFVQAAEDWVYFFDDMDLDEVPAGQEQSWIWSLKGWPEGDAVWNKESYTGFLLYAYGARHTGGGPSWEGGYQSANGETLPLKRSGDISFNMPGEWGTVGHMIGVPDDEWWKETNTGSEPHDPPHGLYSTSYHEIGHALVFCCGEGGHPIFNRFMDLGYVNDDTVKDYYGTYPVMDKSAHFYPLVDPVSRRGAYGGEFGGEMPPGRHILTKGHLLIAQAIGYTLRKTSPFIPLSITTASLPEATSGASYSYTATASGGTPAYHWAIESGTLPAGLSIDSFTGTISGAPTQHGTFNFTISVSDYDETTLSTTRAVTLTIREAVEPQAWLTPDPAAVAFSADDPAWKTFTVHTNLDSVLVRANPSGSDPAIEVAGGQQVPTKDFCPAEGNDRPSSGRRDGWSLHVKACQAGQTKILLIDYATRAVLQQYEIHVEASTSEAAATALNPSHPNPFNSETILSYTLKAASDIRLEVFALNGQRIAVLQEGLQAAGYHAVSVDASAWASGVYLYRLTTPEGRFVQKFTLLR